MVLNALFGKNTREDLEEGDYIELDATALESGSGKIPIKIEKLEEFSDSDRIQKEVREGAIVLVKIKALKDKDISELKRVIDKLRKTCIAINGDIAGIDEDWICLTPSFAHIAREK